MKNFLTSGGHPTAAAATVRAGEPTQPRGLIEPLKGAAPPTTWPELVEELPGRGARPIDSLDVDGTPPCGGLCAPGDDPAFNGGPIQGARPVGKLNAPAKPRTASDILREMAQTMDDRNDQYHDNWRMIAPMLKILFPKGVPPEMVTQDFWHLFELLLVKIARFASTNCTHIDSIHDAGAYCGFVQLAIEETLKDSK